MPSDSVRTHTRVLLDMIETVFGEKDRGYWEVIIRHLDKAGWLRVPQQVPPGLFDLIEEDAQRPKPGSAFSDRYAPAIVRIPYSKLRRFGRVDDFCSPVGFWGALSPFAQTDEDALLIYAPCTVGIPGRLRYGPEICALYAANAAPGLNVGDVYAAAKERFDRLRQAPSTKMKIWMRLSRIAERLKEAVALFVPLRQSQHFYEEGIRFYKHSAAKHFYVSATTPGLFIPEEYYGGIYFAGISKVVPPGGLLRALKGGPPGPLENWRFLLRQALFKTPATEVKNPFRTVYFEEGLLPAHDVTYIAFSESTQRVLGERIAAWRLQHLDDEYLGDATEILSQYLARHSIVCSDASAAGTGLDKYTLLSDGYWLTSERDAETRKMVHGRKWNIAAITKCLSAAASAVPLATKLAEVIEIAIGREAENTTRIGLHLFFDRILKGAASVAREATPLKRLIGLWPRQSRRPLRERVRFWYEKGFPFGLKSTGAK